MSVVLNGVNVGEVVDGELVGVAMKVTAVDTEVCVDAEADV